MRLFFFIALVAICSADPVSAQQLYHPKGCDTLLTFVPDGHFVSCNCVHFLRPFIQKEDGHINYDTLSKHYHFEVPDRIQGKPFRLEVFGPTMTILYAYESEDKTVMNTEWIRWQYLCESNSFVITGRTKKRYPLKKE